MTYFNDHNSKLLVYTEVTWEAASVWRDDQNTILVHLEADVVVDRTSRSGREATELEILDELLVVIGYTLIHLDAYVILVVRVGTEVCEHLVRQRLVPYLDLLEVLTQLLVTKE